MQNLMERQVIETWTFHKLLHMMQSERSTTELQPLFHAFERLNKIIIQIYQTKERSLSQVVLSF